ncbi:MAG: hypothetical protein WC654_04420 [Patescibacteria group bacterium]
MDHFYLFGTIMLVGQLMFDQFKKIRETKYVGNISLLKWISMEIVLVTGALHTTIEKPNLYVFIPILPGLIFTSIIVWQIFHYRRPSHATSLKK